MEKEGDIQERARFAEVLRGLAETSTWHGVTKIVSSPQRAVKCLWCIFMMAALGMTLWNLSVLFETFYDRPVQTTVSLEFSSHRFPAVSFCNLNPIRRSQIGLAPELRKVLRTKITPDETPSTSSLVTTSGFTSTSSSTSSTTSPTFSPGSTSHNSMSTPLNSNVTLDPNVTDSELLENVTAMNRTELNSTPYTVKHEEHEEPDPRERWEEVTKTFKSKFRNESVKVRIQMGHQKEDFIHRAAFGGKQLGSERFKLFTSSDYGNCFTMDSSDYKAWRSGSEHGYVVCLFMIGIGVILVYILLQGIKLRLNLEVDEYIENFSSGYGVRMVFHEPGTFPMPAEEGLTLSPGYESMIGLRKVTISRLGQPFGNCTHGDEFKRLYNVSYSVAVLLRSTLICGMKLWPAEGLQRLHLLYTVSPNRKVKNGHKRFIFYSDNCTAQNKNRFYITLICYCLQRFDLISIEHKYLEKGQKFNENDSVHPLKLHQDICLSIPHHSGQLSSELQGLKKTYNVHEMSFNDFFDFKQLSSSLKHFDLDINRQKVYVSEIKSFYLNSSDLNMYFFKYDHGSEMSSCVNLLNRLRWSLDYPPNPKTINLFQLQTEPEPIPITAEKYNDLVSLCLSGVIQRPNHVLYVLLPHTTST